jgi:hypothetical protein
VARFEELEGGNVRASDRDRDRVAAELRLHCQEGRISVEELELRLERAIVAQTIHELAELLVDLPSRPAALPLPRAAAPPRIGPPGVRPFTVRIRVPAPAARARDLALDTIAPGLNGFGFELRWQTREEMEFVRMASRRAAQPERVVISFEPAGAGRSTMIVHGRATRRVRKAFAGLSFD